MFDPMFSVQSPIYMICSQFTIIIFMNSKGFRNFQKGFQNSNFGGSNPRAMLPFALLGGLLWLSK